MAFHLADYEYADRRTATAGEAMTAGMVVKISGQDANGMPQLMKMGNGDTATAGKYGVVNKVDVRSDVVDTSSIASTNSALGGTTRVDTIVSGDAVTISGRGTFAAYDFADLHASLTSANTHVGDYVQVVGSVFCLTGTGSANATVTAMVTEVHENNVTIQLLL